MSGEFNITDNSGHLWTEAELRSHLNSEECYLMGGHDFLTTHFDFNDKQAEVIIANVKPLPR